MKLKQKNWVKSVTTETVSVEQGTMKKSTKEMVKSLIEKNKHLPNPRASINRYLQYYINRNKSRIPEERQQAIKDAQELIRKKLSQ